MLLASLGSQVDRLMPSCGNVCLEFGQSAFRGAEASTANRDHSSLGAFGFLGLWVHSWRAYYRVDAHRPASDVSFVPQRDHWIDIHCTTRRHVARQHRHRNQQNGNGDEGCRVECTRPVNQATHKYASHPDNGSPASRPTTVSHNPRLETSHSTSRLCAPSDNAHQSRASFLTLHTTSRHKLPRAR